MRLSTASLDDARPRFEAWRTLADYVLANPSHYPEWTAITAKSHRLWDKVELVTVEEGSTLSAVLPIYCSSRRSLGLSARTLELVTNSVSYHNRPVTTLSPDSLMDLLHQVARERGLNAIHLANVPSDSDIGGYLETAEVNRWCYKQVCGGESSPYLTLSQSWDNLLASKPKKFRYKLRKRQETVESDPRLSTAIVTDEAQCAALLDAIKHIEKNSWKVDAGIAIHQRPVEAEYYAMLLPYLARINALYANLVLLDDQPIAYNLCCVWRGWVGQLKTSFDARYSDISPGAATIDMGIRRAVDIGASEFDFLGEADRHKLSWSRSIRSHKDYFLYLKSSLSGRLIGQLKSLRGRLAASATRA